MQISDMISGVNLIGGKVSPASINRAGRSGGIPDSKEDLDWLKLDLNAVKIITVQDWKKKKQTKKNKKANANGSTHIQC